MARATGEIRRQVLDAARPLVTARGLPPVARIAARAGISRATFYRHFQGRAELARELRLEPDRGSRRRALEAALELLERHGVAGLALDRVSDACGLSRATVYRLFPGRGALFRELLEAYSPLEAVVETVERMRERPPEEVMPAVAAAMARSLEGRVGLVRAVLFEMTTPSPETLPGLDYFFTRGMGTVLDYLARQAAAGRIRTLHPVLAAQAFAGPIILHLLTRELVVERLGLPVSGEEAARELAEAWLRAMRSAPGAGAGGRSLS